MQNEESQFSLKSLFVPFTTSKAIHYIIIIGIIVYANSLFNGFIGDDNGQILDNKLVHSLTNFFSFFSNGSFSGAGSAGIYYKPIFSIVLSLLYSLFGPISFFFHCFQLILHITNTTLVFIFFNRFLKKYIAFFLSLVFLVHPINAESVVYISDIQETLFFFFGMISFLLVTSEKINVKKLIFCGVFLLLSLFSKETGILFLLISFSYILIYKRKLLNKYSVLSGTVLSMYFLCRFAIAGIYFNRDQINPIMHAPLIDRILSIPAILHYYLFTFLFPINVLFNQEWVVSQITFNSFLLPLFWDLVFILLYVSLIIYILKFSKKAKSIILFSSLWIIFGIGLHLQLFPLDATVADRWFYFPMVGLLLVIGLGLQSFNEKIHVTNKYSVLASLGVIIVILLSTRTMIRNTNWHDPITLYTHDISLMQPNFSLENALAFEYAKIDQNKEALVHAQRSVDIFPTFVNYTNLGALYVKEGEIDKGKYYYEKAIENDPQYYLAYQNLSLLLLKYKSLQEAKSFIRKTTTMFPLGEKVWFYRIVVEYKTGDNGNALLASEKYYLLKKDQPSFDIYTRLSQKLSLEINIQ